MRTIRLAALLSTLFLLAPLALAQKPCVAFSSDNSSTSHFSRDALQTAVTQSPDIDFFPSEHGGCWAVHEISAPITGTQSYAISWVVVDPHNGFIGHGLNVGKTEEFTTAMRAAAAEAEKSIRLQTVR